MSDIKVSIIIPTYNAECYIRECIESLLKQNLQETEIIVVNDGSIDKTLNILKEYIFKDSRIVVINQSNKGVSAARNRGIKEAKGAFIAFVDADDYVDKTIYEVMYNKAVDNQSDIVVCGSYIMQNNEMKKQMSFDNEITVAQGNIDFFNFLKHIFLKKEYRTSCWNKLYRAEIIKGKINFINYSNVLSEDTLFNFNVLLQAERVTIIPHCLYFHQVIDGSLSHSKKYKNVAIRNANQISEMCDLIKKNNNTGLETLFHYYYLQGLSNIAELEINHNGNDFKGLMKEVRFYRTKKNTHCINYHSDVSKIIESKGKVIYYYLLNIFDQLNSDLLLAIILYLKTTRRMTSND